jgi:hypothetical protein
MTAMKGSLMLTLAVMAPLAAATATAADGFTRQFPLSACDFRPSGGNAYFNLKPGRQLYLSNQRCLSDGDCDELEEVWITVLPDTRLVKFSQGSREYAVRTRVVQEYETADGEVEEISYNFFANCAPMNDVYYFGEEVFDGEGNPEDDAWIAGKDGARPGIIMPDRAFLLGSRYYQEIAPNAKDRGEHTAMGFEAEVPAGMFRNCVEVTETSPLEPGEESIKVYCPNVGLVIDDDLELMAIYEDAEPPVAD